jgi:hypothetical protein
MAKERWYLQFGILFLGSLFVKGWLFSKVEKDSYHKKGYPKSNSEYPFYCFKKLIYNPFPVAAQ